MVQSNRKVRITVEEDGKRRVTEQDIPENSSKVVVVINNQIALGPNTTQIASGAGRNSAAGNNAALDSSNTEQQQSVGAQGKAENFGMTGKQIEPHTNVRRGTDEDPFVLVINNQQSLSTSPQNGVTQVGSGSGTDSTGGTNSAIASSNSKQQHAVGGGGEAINKGMKNAQIETRKKTPHVIWPGWNQS